MSRASFFFRVNDEAEGFDVECKDLGNGMTEIFHVYGGWRKKKGVLPTANIPAYLKDLMAYKYDNDDI